MLFRRVELIEARPEDTRLPIVSSRRSDVLLRKPIIDVPDLGSVVVGAIADHDHAKEGLVAGEIDVVMELAGQGMQAFEKSLAHCFKVGLASFAIRSSVGILAAVARNVAIEADRFGVGRHAPFGSSEKDTDVAAA